MICRSDEDNPATAALYARLKDSSARKLSFDIRATLVSDSRDPAELKGARERYACALGMSTRVEVTVSKGGGMRQARLGVQDDRWQSATSVVRLTFFRSAARGLHAPAARRAASRKASRGSGGPAYGRASAAAKS